MYHTSAFVSIKFLVKAGGMVDPVKFILSYSLITTQNLVAVCHTVWAYAGPKNLCIPGVLLL